MSVDKLVKAVWNYKQNDDVTLQKLVENIKKNGVVETILVRELDTGYFEIINGNHRYDAIQSLNIPDVMVCNLGKISESRAKRLAIELNETSFPNDNQILASILKEISKEFGVDDILSSLPYSEKELDKFLSMENWAVHSSSSDSSSSMSEDSLSIRISLTFEQHESWIAWKNACGTDNDTLALMRAVEAAQKT